MTTARAMRDGLMTQDGYDRLRQELHALKTIARSDVAKRLRDAREDGGDAAENGDLMDALEQQTLLERRISALKARLASARIAPANDDGSAGIGSLVRLRTTAGEIVEYELVGTAEADPSAGRISIESPVGQALIGCRAGERVEVEAPKRVRRFEVLSVRLEDASAGVARAA